MKRRLLPLALVCACGESSSGADVQPAVCAAFERPALDEAVALERAFAGVDLEGGVDLEWAGGRWYVATRPGVIYVFDDREDATPEVALDIRDRVDSEAGEAGLLAIAFDREDTLYVSYTTPGASPFRSRVSRFVGTQEEEIITVDQPFSNHNGGDISFGPDGYLYVGLGDGGSRSDPQGNGQNPDTLLGSMLRLDVSVDSGYAIPPDNPYVDGGGRPEIFATGLRNPWRFSFDRDTGTLWAGDVGQNLWEEVDVIERGGNYGWNVTEGEGCFGTDTCDANRFAAPVVQYRNVGVATVIGGFVYRGTALPELAGAYLYSDYYLGTIWTVRAGEEPRVVNRGQARRISSWAQDPDGELLGVSTSGGIFRVIAAPTRDGGDFPSQLSQTGCVDPADPTAPPPGAVAYEVRVPFWSDGADKTRFALLPEGTSIDVDETGDLHLPVGSVLSKSFSRDGTLLETRLLVRDDAGWAGYSYAWREDGSDADVLLDGRIDGDWVFPDGQQCDFCHTSVAGGSLGLEAAQLGEELAKFVDAGWLDTLPSASALPDPFGDAPVDERARSYLHVNCAQCHQPDGPSGRADIDLRANTPLAQTGLCDEPPSAGTADVDDGRLLAPGDPPASILLARIRSDGSTRMPPVGSLRVDDDGAAVVEAWIASLSACP